MLADTEDVWTQIFPSGRRPCPMPRLVLLRGSTPTACGLGESAAGPFCCPGDGKVCIDLLCFDTLRSRLGATGDFAQACVIAHAVGRHVQDVIGVARKMEQMRGRVSQAEMNAMSVRVELQADCLAGVWAHHSQRGKGWLEAGDIDEALNAAARIGDDTLQRNAGRAVVPESFTHGTSQQRMTWFSRGLQAGSVTDCNTFDARVL